MQLAEIGRFDDTVTYDDYLADFSASFHDLRRAARVSRLPRSATVTSSRRRSPRHCSTPGSLGVVYPSVRTAGGTCVACFRPALVTNVRQDKTYRFTWDGRRRRRSRWNLEPTRRAVKGNRAR